MRRRQRPSRTSSSAQSAARSTRRPATVSIAAARPASSGGKARIPTLTPIPTTAASSRPLPAGSASVRIPAILRRANAEAPPGAGAAARPPAGVTTTSFGHFSSAATPAVPRTASATATPASRVTTGGWRPRRTTDRYNPAPGEESHARPRRPRPAVWRPATTVVPSAAPDPASAAAVSLVDASSGKYRTTAPASSERAASADARSGGNAACVGVMPPAPFRS